MVCILAAVALTSIACGDKAVTTCEFDPPVCARNVLQSCAPDGGVLRLDCGEARCAFDAPEPACVPAHALPCDPTQTAPSCENGERLECPPLLGYRVRTPCGDHRLCQLEGGLPVCVTVAGTSCRPADFAPLCLEGRRIECDVRERVLVDRGPCT